MKAKQKMQQAYAIWVFSWMIWHNTWSGKIDYSKFPKNFSIESESGAVAFKTDIPSTETEKLALNNMIAVTGVCFSTFDSAMDEAYGNLDKALPIQVTGLSAARVIVKQVRNAYAHDPIHPKWVVRNPTHRKILQITEIGLTVNLDSLNDCDFKVEHINGFGGLAKLLKYCLDNVTN
jgi:hypothetical protein